MLRETYLKTISPFIEKRSISTDKAFAGEMEETVEWLEELFRQKGFTVEVFREYGNPIVFASYQKDPSFPWVAVYGHYDVQPAPVGEWGQLTEQEKMGWKTPPFQLTETEDGVVARGVADNKGQVGIHMDAVFGAIESGELSSNVSFIIEGDEETAEGKIEKFIEDQAERLREYSCLLISDGLLENNVPTIERSFRGSVSGLLRFTTSGKDLHSGLYGGAVPSASNELITFLGSLHKNGRIVIPGWYEGIQAPSEMEVLSEERLRRMLTVTGVRQFMVPDSKVVRATAFEPAIIFTGVQSGYTGEGHQNIIPGTAWANFNFRLAPGQEPETMIESFREFVKSNVPSSVEVEMEFSGVMPGVYLDADNEESNRAQKILTEVYGAVPIHAFIGASMPISVEVERRLGIPQLLLPLANDDANIHGSNENLTYEALDKALGFSEQFFTKRRE